MAVTLLDLALDEGQASILCVRPLLVGQARGRPDEDEGADVARHRQGVKDVEARVRVGEPALVAAGKLLVE
jgi:hypothetical protein